MKRVGRLWERICTYDNVCLAYAKARRGKRMKADVLRFEEELEDNISSIVTQMKNGTYQPGTYHFFKIYDPKERLISAASFTDRVVHHAVMNVCHPYFDRTLIHSTHATRVGKGIYTALEQAQRAMARHLFVAKLDVRHYFDSIDHAILLTRIMRLFKDEELLNFFHRLIESYETTEGRGVPIGNLTSQYFANHYLSGLDHYVKETLRIPVYVRYMDDMLLFADDKATLKKAVAATRNYCSDKLHLQLKPSLLYRSNQGTPFLGYRVMPHHLLLSGRSKRRFRTKLFSLARQYNEGDATEETTLLHLRPLFAFTQQAHSNLFRRECLHLLNERGLTIQ